MVIVTVEQVLHNWPVIMAVVVGMDVHEDLVTVAVSPADGVPMMQG